MGVEPLPFDERGGCFCTFGCPDFHKPEQRYWVVVDTQGDVPRLDAGAVFQRLLPFPPGQTCQFTPDPPFPGNVFTSLIKGTEMIGSLQSYFWQFLYQESGPVNVYEAKQSFPQVECGGQLGWVAQTAPAGWGPVQIFPIRWYENANDVPH